MLEARERYGGRVHTVEVPEQGLKIDHGAAWIHGRGPGALDFPLWDNQLNPLYEIALKHGIETVPCWDGDRDPK